MSVEYSVGTVRTHRGSRKFPARTRDTLLTAYFHYMRKFMRAQNTYLIYRVEGRAEFGERVLFVVWPTKECREAVPQRSNVGPNKQALVAKLAKNL